MSPDVADRCRPAIARIIEPTIGRGGRKPVLECPGIEGIAAADTENGADQRQSSLRAWQDLHRVILSCRSTQSKQRIAVPPPKQSVLFGNKKSRRSKNCRIAGRGLLSAGHDLAARW